MTAVLLDTHTWVWSMTATKSLSRTAMARIGDAETVFVSPVSFFEVALKVRIGKWPEMAPLVDDLDAMLDAHGGVAAPLDIPICLYAGTMAWIHRDPFDRILAATSLHYKLDFVSADTAFDDVLKRVW